MNAILYIVTCTSADAVREYYYIYTVCISEVGLNPPNVLLPAENVVGPSQQMFAALLIEGMSACFNYTDKQIHVTLNFTQPILITRATSLYVEQFSDGDRSETAYVNTYSISTSADNEHFTTYTDTTGRTVRHCKYSHHMNCFILHDFSHSGYLN